MLDEEVVPRVSQAPGFKTGFWTRAEDGSNGLSMLVFESEEAANGAKQALEQRFATEEAPVDFQGAEVREVVKSA
jgi:hypothetical protein